MPPGGDATLAWRVPPDRFDRFRVRLRRAAGATAPATSTDGTNVAIADLATGVTDSPGAGEFSYALFGQYDETQGKDRGGTPATAERDSVSVTRTVTVT